MWTRDKAKLRIVELDFANQAQEGYFNTYKGTLIYRPYEENDSQGRVRYKPLLPNHHGGKNL